MYSEIVEAKMSTKRLMWDKIVVCTKGLTVEVTKSY